MSAVSAGHRLTLQLDDLRGGRFLFLEPAKVDAAFVFAGQTNAFHDSKVAHSG
jgi:hypothetical protein